MKRLSPLLTKMVSQIFPHNGACRRQAFNTNSRKPR